MYKMHAHQSRQTGPSFTRERSSVSRNGTHADQFRQTRPSFTRERSSVASASRNGRSSRQSIRGNVTNAGARVGSGVSLASFVQRTRSSVEAEQRSVVVTATQTLLEVRNFRIKYRMNHVDNQRISILAIEFLRMSGFSEVECRTREDFQNMLNEKKNDTAWKKKTDADNLELMCERAEKFEIMVPQIKMRLRNCYEDHALKTFRSFSSELENMELRSVSEYEKKIKEYKEKIEADFEQLDSFFQKHQEMKVPFVLNYLGCGGQVTSLVEQCTSIIVDICEVIKKWSNQDKAYPKKLWDETINTNVQRGKVIEEVKRLQRKKDDLQHTLTRKEGQRDKSIQKFEETRRDGAMMEAKCDKAKKVLADMEEKYKQISEEIVLTENKINDRKSNSPKYFETLWAIAEDLKVALSKASDMRDGQMKQVNRLVRSHQDINATIELFDKEVKSQMNQVDILETRVQEVNEEMWKANEELKTLEAKSAAAKHIRDLKVVAPTSAMKWLTLKQKCEKGNS